MAMKRDGALGMTAHDKDVFVAKEKFVEDVGPKVKVRISFIGENFIDNFLDKVEPPNAHSALCRYQMTITSTSRNIIACIGNEEAAETTLRELYALLEKQGCGQRGDLLIDGRENVFYIRSVKHEVWAVACSCWHDAYWHIYARPINDQRKWKAGDQIFFRNLPK